MRRVLHKLPCSYWFLNVWWILILEFLEGHEGILQHSLSLLLPVNINDVVLCSIGPGVETSTIFLACLPLSFKFLSTWIVKDSCPMAFIVLELSFIDLAVWPVEFSFSRLLAASPLPLIEGTIFPLEVAKAIHLIIAELTLKDLALWSHSSAKSMSLTFREETFINWAVRENLDTLAIWLPWSLIDFATELRTWLSLVKTINQRFLFIGAIVSFDIVPSSILVIVKGA